MSAHVGYNPAFSRHRSISASSFVSGNGIDTFGKDVGVVGNVHSGVLELDRSDPRSYQNDHSFSDRHARETNAVLKAAQPSV